MRFNEFYERRYRAVLAFCLRRTKEPDAYDAIESGCTPTHRGPDRREIGPFQPEHTASTTLGDMTPSDKLARVLR